MGSQRAGADVERLQDLFDIARVTARSRPRINFTPAREDHLEPQPIGLGELPFGRSFFFLSAEICSQDCGVTGGV